jgi:hypothetical protein
VDGGTLWEVSLAAPIRLSAGGTNDVYEHAILHNALSKRSRHGAFDRNVFILTSEELMYFRLPASKAATGMIGTRGELTPGSYPAPPEPARVLQLCHVVALYVKLSCIRSASTGQTDSCE